MKKLPPLINFVAYGFALFLFLYVLRVLFHLYVFSHLPGASSYLPDPVLYTQDRVFVYTKRFAELAHLDPTKAIELSPGLEAIEFESGRAIESADIFYPVDYFNIRSDSDRRVVDRVGDNLDKLYPNKIQHSLTMSCHFKVYLDHDIKLQLPTLSESYGLPDYHIKDEIQNSLLYHFEESGLWPPTKGDLLSIKQKRTPLQGTFEDDSDGKIFLFNKKNVRHRTQVPEKYNDLGIPLDYNEYIQNILPGIDFIRFGDIFGCNAIENITDNPQLFIEKLNGKNYPHAMFYASIDKINLDDFLQFSFPDDITHSSRYKTLILTHKNKI